MKKLRFTQRSFWITLSLLFCFMEAFPQTTDNNSIQSEANKVIVYLKDGTKISGQLANWDYGNRLDLLINKDQIVQIPSDDIDKVVEQGLDYNASKTPYVFNNGSWYYHFRFNFLAGNAGQRANGTPGAGVSFSAGRRFSRLINVGVGLTYDQYIFNTAERILAPYAELSGFLQPSSFSMMYHVSGGYGFAFADQEFDLEAVDGGWMIYPAFGFITGKKSLRWTVDLGYKFQRAHYLYENSGTTSDQKITYKRATLRLGLVF